MEKQADIGLIGLSVMGSNLALNMADHGYTVAVFNRTRAVTEKFVASDGAKGKGLIPCFTLDELIARIRKPAPVVLMVKAGQPVDDFIGLLTPLLSRGDIIVDAGNSFFKDTIRRNRELTEKGFDYIGTGVSGGEEGARNGPAVMPGGQPGAYARVEPILKAIAAKVNGEPCCEYVGPDGAGHYVKMVHNGIEYADMQLIAEAYFLMRNILGMDYPSMQRAFASWNAGDLESYLIEITADILGRLDPGTGKPICEIIKDRAGQKGTGQWTSEQALALGVAAPTMIEAVQARSLSAAKDERLAASGILKGPDRKFSGDREAFVNDVRDALYASKLCCYAQGFQLMAAAAGEYGWKLDFGRIAMMWRGGCIIRARFLQRIKDAYDANPGLANLLLDPYFRDIAAKSQGAWRRVVAASVEYGVAIPAFASALSYYDGYRAATLPANMIQAQRDYFGAHTYERIDREGWFHTEWMKP